MTTYQPYPMTTARALPTRLVSGASAPSLALATDVGLLELGIPGTTPAGTWPENYRATPRIAAVPLAISGSVAAVSSLAGALRPVAMTPEMAAAIEAGLAYWLLEIDAADVSERVAQVAGYASASGGLYTGRLSSVGPWSEAGSDRRFALQGVNVPCQIEDDDAAFAALVAGRYGPQLRKATARVKVAAPSVEPKAWFTAFSGLLLSFSRTGLQGWKLQLGTDDLPLKRKAPRATFTRTTTPRAKADVLGKAIPFGLGVFDSTSTTGTGALPTFRVDDVLFRYAFGLGAWQSVDRVCVGGALQAAAAWSFVVAEVGGVLLSMVQFAADPGADAVVTVDARGLTDVYDGSGELVLDPVDQFELALRLVVWNDWRRGPYPAPSTVPVDADALALVKDYLANRTIAGGHQGSAYFGSQRTGRDILNTWCESWGVRACWSPYGRVRLYAEDDPEDTYLAEYLPEAEVEIGERADLDYDVANVVDGVQVRYLPDPASGDLRATLTVQDSGLGEVGTDTMDLTWSRAEG